MLTDLVAVDAARLPVSFFREHLRLGTGFADDALQTDLLEGHLRAALEVVEARTGRAILTRQMRIAMPGWGDAYSLRLPRCPVVTIDAVRVIAASGTEVLVDPAKYRLVNLAQRASVEALGGFPHVPGGGRVQIDFTAGIADTWSEIPASLAQAVLVIAAAFYERREGADLVPVTVQALLSPFQGRRLGFVRRAL